MCIRDRCKEVDTGGAFIEMTLEGRGPDGRVVELELMVPGSCLLYTSIDAERPHIVVPEIEAISTQTLLELEAAGVARVIPTARAAHLTMNREGIRRLAAETLGLPTSTYRFVDTLEDYRAAVAAIGLPCVVKPVMASSGHGQSLLRVAADLDTAWDYAQTGGRTGEGRVILEGFVDFGYEITLLLSLLPL